MNPAPRLGQRCIDQAHTEVEFVGWQHAYVCVACRGYLERWEAHLRSRTGEIAWR